MNATDAITLLNTHLESSVDSDWSAWSVDDVKAILKRLNLSSHWTKEDRNELAVLLAPTGALQEIAMANDWHDDYMKCATTLDSRLSTGA